MIALELNKPLTRERLRELLTYDPATGYFQWRVTASNRAPAGSMATNVDTTTGYVRVNIDGRRYYAHRLAFLYMTGIRPPAEVDHINGDRSDNRFCNLRLATRSENERNKPVRRDSRVGARGVEQLTSGSFMVRVTVNGRRGCYGTFQRIEDAIARRNEVAQHLHGSFARAS